MARESVMAVLHDVHQEYLKDLESEIMDAVGDMSGIVLWGQEILVAPFHQPTIRKSGIIMAGNDPQAIDDKWQSKTFMVLKLGATAEAAAKKAGKPIPVVGKWYFGAPESHKHMSVMGRGSKNRPPVNGQPYRAFKGWPCRLVLVGDIDGGITRPWEVM